MSAGVPDTGPSADVGGRVSSARRTLLRVGMRLAWLGAACLLAFGSAGLVAAGDHLPTATARPELTWGADQALKPSLDAAVASLGPLSTDVDGLGSLGRQALASLVGQDSAGLTTAIVKGNDLVARITVLEQAIASRIASLPGTGPAMTLQVGDATLQRYQAIERALASTGDLATDWEILVGGAGTAEQLTALLADHDRYAAEAARLGSLGKFSEAGAQLNLASAALTSAGKLRDDLAKHSDVTTLTTWIDRNAAMDTALRELYAAYLASQGRTTPALTAALKAVKTAEENLPPDTRALVVIMADLARGGLNQAVIAIEEARGELAQALGLLGVQPAPTSH